MPRKKKLKRRERRKVRKIRGNKSQTETRWKTSTSRVILFSKENQKQGKNHEKGCVVGKEQDEQKKSEEVGRQKRNKKSKNETKNQPLNSSFSTFPSPKICFTK